MSIFTSNYNQFPQPHRYFPALTFCPYECDTQPITNSYEGTIRVHTKVIHHKYDLGEHKQMLNYELQ